MVEPLRRPPLMRECFSIVFTTCWSRDFVWIRQKLRCVLSQVLCVFVNSFLFGSMPLTASVLGLGFHLLFRDDPKIEPQGRNKFTSSTVVVGRSQRIKLLFLQMSYSINIPQHVWARPIPVKTLFSSCTVIITSKLFDGKMLCLSRVPNPSALRDGAAKRCKSTSYIPIQQDSRTMEGPGLCGGLIASALRTPAD